MKISLNVAYLLPMLLLVGAWLVSNHYPPWSAFYNEFFAVLALLALALTGVIAWHAFSIPGPAVLVGLLACIPLIQFGFGLIDFLGDAIIAASFLGALALSIVVGANMQQFGGARSVEMAKMGSDTISRKQRGQTPYLPRQSTVKTGRACVYDRAGLS